ncbi:site-specific DNA-methyltransferase [Patescibacteria group bacterium]|nr:site-specific DNA-methyltransferase [Patescibacteria group bacterium]
MQNLNKHDIEFLIDCLKNGKEIPDVYKYAIFPTKQKEYELVYAGKMRKEDVLADTEEAKPVPLQIEKIFNGKRYPLYSKDWHNLLVFGDNLQILKTFNENKDALIKNKIKGKVKLIYIDPPFATENEFNTSKGHKAYSDKQKGADFVEFLRRRLILMKELLHDDGSIFVHLDWKKSHYIKIMLDEIFGENSFRNEILWYYTNKIPDTRKKQFTNSTDSILFYTKGKNNYFKHLETIRDIPIKVSKMKKVDGKKIYVKGDDGKGIYEERTTRTMDNVWNIALLHAQAERVDYPTQKPEELLRRVIECSTEKGDIVMDVFTGSGTTLAVAEKLGRRWVGCDIGKLAIYATQKRLLEIDQGKDLENPKNKYNKPAKSFSVVTSGLYDLGKIFALKKDEYIQFVKDLFEIEETKTTKISGVEIDGKKREFYVKIFPYWDFKNTSVDEKYLQELHKNIGKKIDGRFYIIAPANNVDFISDYYQIDNVRYYFLKVPYQIIKELHKVQFKKFRQPQSKSQINDLDEAIGFHFIRQPEVKSEIKTLKDKVVLKIKKFESAYSQDETGEKLKNFESLAMLLVDLNYDGEKFMMTDYFFAQDLLNHKKSEKEESEEEIKEKLTKQKEIIKEFPKKDCGKQVMAVYVDIYGNEFREKFNVK